MKQRGLLLVAILAWVLLGAVGSPAISNLKFHISNLRAGPVPPLPDPAPVVVAQISDLHIGLQENPLTHAPLDPLEHLRRVVAMVNARHPDAVIVSGDIG